MGDLSDSSNFHVSWDAIRDVADSMDEMQNLSNELIGEFFPFDGMMQDNKFFQIRTGIIQDPYFPALQHRVDKDSKELEGVYSVVKNLKAKYPLNGKNAIDTYGMRVSVVWLDGNETGMHHDSTQPSKVGKPVQKLWLSFPNAWSDRDRSCGDFNLPVVGTVCRIGLLRSDIGVFLGALPMDRENLPHLNLGDFLRRHYSQSCQYITDNFTQDAYRQVLDKDIFKKKLSLQAIPPNKKNYETNENTLGNLYRYHANRHVIAQDGISTSTKQTKNAHCETCNKRTFEFNTNKSLSDALMIIRNSCQPTAVRITCPDGLFEFDCKSEGSDPATLKEASFRVTTNNLTIEELADIIEEHFDCSETKGIIAVTDDAYVTWSRRIGEAKSSITNASDVRAAVFKIMGREGKWYKVEGPDEVLTGDCPRTGDSENTCSRPND